MAAQHLSGIRISKISSGKIIGANKVVQKRSNKSQVSGSKSPVVNQGFRAWLGKLTDFVAVGGDFV